MLLTFWSDHYHTRRMAHPSLFTQHHLVFFFRLEIENAKIEATAKQQSVQIETLQKELQESISVSNSQLRCWITLKAIHSCNNR